MPWCSSPRSSPSSFLCTGAERIGERKFGFGAGNTLPIVSIPTLCLLHRHPCSQLQRITLNTAASMSFLFKSDSSPYYVPNGGIAIAISQTFGSAIFGIYTLLVYNTLRSRRLAQKTNPYFWLAVANAPGNYLQTCHLPLIDILIWDCFGVSKACLVFGQQVSERYMSGKAWILDSEAAAIVGTDSPQSNFRLISNLGCSRRDGLRDAVAPKAVLICHLHCSWIPFAWECRSFLWHLRCAGASHHN